MSELPLDVKLAVRLAEDIGKALRNFLPAELAFFMFIVPRDDDADALDIDDVPMAVASTIPPDRVAGYLQAAIDAIHNMEVEGHA